MIKTCPVCLSLIPELGAYRSARRCRPCRRLEKAEADAIYGKALSKELGQKCDALIAQNEKLQRDVEYHKSAAEAASKIMHQIDDAWKADKTRLEKLERVRQLADDFLNVCWTEESRKELQEALAACPPKEGQ